MTGSLEGAKNRMQKETPEERLERMRELGLRSQQRLREKYTPEQLKARMAAMGKKGKTGGFASEKIGPDGLTGPQRAKAASQKGIEARMAHINNQGANNETS